MRKTYFVGIAAAVTATVGVMTPSAFASGATVTQVSTVNVDSAYAGVTDIGTINSQFSSITIDATGSTTWCNDSPNPPCTANPGGADYYWLPPTIPTLGPDPADNVGALIAKVGNGPWQVVGSHMEFTSPTVADVYVAYNDNIYTDNTGSYTLTITRVKPAS